MPDILNQIDESIARNAARFDVFGPDPRTFKSGIEEEAEPAGTVVEMLATVEFGESAPICRGCRRPAAQRPVERDRLCCFCLAAPSCDNSRVNGVNGRHMVCIRPAGHTPPCEEGHPDGSQWYPSGVEQDGYWVATPAPLVDAALVLDLDASSLQIRTFSQECGAQRCDDCGGDAVDLLSACLHECHTPRPWWRRYLPGGTR